MPRPMAGAESSASEAPAGPGPWGETTVVGKPLPRVDAYERVSGSAVFTLDLSLPDMLHAAILRCPHAHAMVEKVDTATATAMPGVRAVITNADPEARISVPYPWWTASGPEMRLFDAHCRHEGEEVAAVAAETLPQAWDAVRAIRVAYKELPFVVDPAEALRPGAPPVHEQGNLASPRSVYERGDVARGFAEADVVLEQTYRTSCQIHTTMETHGSVARWDGGRLTVWDSTQGVFQMQQYLSKALGLPLSSVRVIGHYMGGGFGSKLELGKYTVLAALLARKTARPVKLFLTREESFLCAGNRPANTMTLKAGVKKDGTLTALRFESTGTVGAYADDATVAYQVSDLYLCPNVRTEETEVYTNAGKARAMRGPGFPQCSWALEQMMDALAEKIGMDPIDLRLRNVPTSSVVRGNQPFTSTGLSRCLTEGAAAFGWKEARGRPPSDGPVRRGVGVAACMWAATGGPPATAIVKLFADGSVNLNMGVSDIGTGTKTIMAMVVAEELGVPLERIQIEHADTATTQFSQGSGGSGTVIRNAPAVRAAAIDVRRQLLDMAAGELKRPAEELVFKDGRIAPKDEPGDGRPVSELKGLVQQQVIVGIGHRLPNPPGKLALPFAAHFAEVEVNALTGEARVVRLLGAHDSGRVMNPLTYRNQVFGGMTMGIGFGMTERRVLDGGTGKVVSANWHDYKIPTALDVPAEMACLPIDPHDTECNTVGAKGLGEPATIPTAAAIANAVYHATGIRVTDAPINTTTLVGRLAEKRGKG